MQFIIATIAYAINEQIACWSDYLMEDWSAVRDCEPPTPTV
jgi:hypothetical protein